MDDKFTPPPPIDKDTQDQLLKAMENATELDRFLFNYKVHNDPEYRRKYLKPLIDRDKKKKRNLFVEWWWGKGIHIVNLVLALIAAITGVLALLQ